MVVPADLKSFLIEVKKADLINFIPTDKNRRTRLSLGLTTQDMEDIVRNLEEKDYHKGPMPDKDSTKAGSVWVFKHNHEGSVLYIKLKDKIIVNETTSVLCLSCHIDNI